MKRLIQSVSVLSVLLLSALAVQAVDDVSWGSLKAYRVAGKKLPKVDICHYSGDEDQFHIINVSGNAVDKHFSNHGDSFPGAYYADADGDGFGDADGAAVECSGTELVDNNLDSDDTDAAINPDADEVCDDGIDNNSDGQIDEDCDGGCGPTDCTVDGTCLSDDYTVVLGAEGDLDDIVSFVEPETFTTGSGVCYAVPVGNGGNNVTWVGPDANTGLVLSGAPGLLAFFGGGVTESKATTDLVTTAGATYEVSFDVRRIEYNGPWYPRHEITVSAVDGGGSTVGSSGPVVHPTSPAVTVTFTFEALSSQTTLVMEGTLLGNNPNQDVGFDNLVVAKLP